MADSWTILQTCVPAYRRPLFDELFSILGGGFKVVAGDRFFDESLRTEAEGCSWYEPCRNRFLLGGSFLWQSGPAMRRLPSGPLVVEGNPRCLRTWWLLLKCRLRKVPVAVWGHALGRRTEQKQMPVLRHLMFQLATTIICYCYREKEVLQHMFPRKDILVAGNSTVRRAECSVLSAPAPSRNKVLFMGRMVASKKPLLLLQAIKEMWDGELKLGAIFIGDGPERVRCQEYAREAGFPDVKFVGQCFDRSKQRDYAASCFALVSAGYVGLSAIDAQSFGLPVIFSPSEPNAPEVETLAQGDNALEFCADSPSDLARAIREIYVNREEWLARGAARVVMLGDRYSIERMASQFALFFHNSKAKTHEMSSSISVP